MKKTVLAFLLVISLQVMAQNNADPKMKTYIDALMKKTDIMPIRQQMTMGLFRRLLQFHRYLTHLLSQ